MIIRNISRYDRITGSYYADYKHNPMSRIYKEAVTADIVIGAAIEKGAYSSEKNWWNYYNFMNGGK